MTLRYRLTLHLQNERFGSFLPYAGIIRVRFDGCILSCRFIPAAPRVNYLKIRVFSCEVNDDCGVEFFIASYPKLKLLYVMKHLSILLITLLAFCGGNPMQAQEYKPAFEKFILSNGLPVTLHRDTTAPLISVHIAYKAGSARDMPGKSGTASIAIEMFLTGMKRFGNNDFIRWQKELYAAFNAQTGVDWVNFSSLYPKSYLDTALVLEADRMANAAGLLDEDMFERVRKRIISELNAAGKQPLGNVDAAIFRELYSDEHPYSHLSSGTIEGLENLTFKDVRQFITMLYVPMNASLTIGGNFDIAKTKRLVQQYFASIPPGRRFPWSQREGSFSPLGTASFIAEEAIEFNRLILVFPTVKSEHEDENRLNLFGEIMTGSRFGRLTEELSSTRADILSVEAYQSSQELSGNFWIIVTAKKDTDLTSVYKQIMRQLQLLSSQEISDEELREAKNHAAFNFYNSLELFYGFSGRCDLLNLGCLYNGNPLFTFEKAISREHVSSGSLRRIARTYLIENNVLVVSVVPAGGRDFAAKP